MSISYRELSQDAQARGMVYSFFADVFSIEVSREFVDRMASFEAAPGSLLEEFASSLATADLDEVTQDLRSEFCALFLNMSAHPVFTSESVYLSDNHIIMQEPRDQVVEAYRASGLAVDGQAFDWPEDHVSMEALFMAHLCEEEAGLCRRADEGESLDDQIEAARAAQRSFFEEHLDRWAPLLAAELAQQATTLFYQGVAEYLTEFLGDERRLLSASS